MIEVSSGTAVTGASDDLIVLTGELYEEFSCYSCADGTDGLMAFSDGTLLEVKYDENGLWRFKPIYKGTLYKLKIEGSISEDKNDEVYFKQGLQWCVFSEEMQVEVNRTREG